MRGYAIDSFRLEECTPIPDSAECPEFDRLVGSRMAVVNLELRVPLFGFEDYGLVRFPALATELVGFVDGGVAWTKGESPQLRYAEDSPERVPVFSAGVAARTVLLGVLPLELYYAWPLQRPEENGVFGVLIATGW